MKPHLYHRSDPREAYRTPTAITKYIQDQQNYNYLIMDGFNNYRNSFFSTANTLGSAGPEHYTTKADPIEYRGFAIYERMPFSSKTKYGEIDTVIGGLCIMISVTVPGAKYRIDQLLAENGEDRARAKMKAEGIAMPSTKPATLFDPAA
jgi:hypothetical protein